MPLPGLSWGLLTHYTAVTGSGDAVTHPKYPSNISLERFWATVGRVKSDSQERPCAEEGVCMTLGGITHPLALRPPQSQRKHHAGRCIIPVQWWSLCQVQLPANSHPAHGQGQLLPAERAPHLALGTDKSHDRGHMEHPPSAVQQHLPWASSIIPGTMMRARARSLTTDRAVCSRALQVTLQELRVRTVSAGKITLLQLQPVLNTHRKKYSSPPCPRGAGGRPHLYALEWMPGVRGVRKHYRCGPAYSV